MLVLSRKRNQTIIIGDNIKIMVLDVKGENVRLGIEAPATTTVHREEVHDAIKRQQEDQQ